MDGGCGGRYRQMKQAVKIEFINYGTIVRGNLIQGPIKLKN